MIDGHKSDLKGKSRAESLNRRLKGNKDVLIEASNISKKYESQGGKNQSEMVVEEKVTDVSFTIFENEIMGILGPSGAGKSSIFKMVTMAMSRSAGQIELIGKNFSHPLSYDELTKGEIGIVYQDDVMWPELSVDENLTYIGRLKGMDAEDLDHRMTEMKKLLNLQVHSHKAAKNLSGGNKRKLCCAMALLSTPRIVFMDEASNGVDPVSRKNLYTHLKRMRETSTLLITHRIDEAENICDKIAIMADGKFLDLDHPDALKERHGVVYILQIEPSVAMNTETINSRITMTLPFCQRIYSMNDSDTDDERIQFRPKLTYRFDDIEEYARINKGGDKSSNRNSSFLNSAAQEASRKAVSDVEVRKKIVFMFRFVTNLMREGVINDFSIFRSSLEQVFKKMVLQQQRDIEDNSQLVVRNEPSHSFIKGASIIMA